MTDNILNHLENAFALYPLATSDFAPKFRVGD